jgi:hypothetical protein
MKLKDVVSGKIRSEHVTSKHYGIPRSGYKLTFHVHEYKNKILHSQYLTIESTCNFGFDSIAEVSLEIGGKIIETHSGQLLKYLSRNNKDLSTDPNKFIVPLHFFYCKTPLILAALKYHEVRVLVELNKFQPGCEITSLNLDSIMVIPERIRCPLRTVIEIITAEYPENRYNDIIVADNKVYYLVNKTITYEEGCFTVLGHTLFVDFTK